VKLDYTQLINYKKNRELIKTITFYNNAGTSSFDLHLHNHIVKKYN